MWISSLSSFPTGYMPRICGHLWSTTDIQLRGLCFYLCKWQNLSDMICWLWGISLPREGKFHHGKRVLFQNICRMCGLEEMPSKTFFPVLTFSGGDFNEQTREESVVTLLNLRGLRVSLAERNWGLPLRMTCFLFPPCTPIKHLCLELPVWNLMPRAVHYAMRHLCWDRNVSGTEAAGWMLVLRWSSEDGTAPVIILY